MRILYFVLDVRDLDKSLDVTLDKSLDVTLDKSLDVTSRDLWTYVTLRNLST